MAGDNTPQSNYERNKVSSRVFIGGVQFAGVTMKEILLSENLLTPGLQTAVTLQSFVHTTNRPNVYEDYKNKDVSIELFNTTPGTNQESRIGIIRQKIYRLDNRSLMPHNISPIEEFTLHACDPSLLEDAKSLVSKSWKCTQPSEIVQNVLSTCLNVQSLDIDDSSNPGRDYIAERIHPFQVVSQQANVALDRDDPSYLHYMTYNTVGQNGTHHFRSLKSLSEGSIYKTYYAYESGVRGYQHYNSPLQSPDRQDFAIGFSFPCDFDLLSDALNGIDEGGMDINVLSVFDESIGAFGMLGDMAQNMDFCGKGGNFKISKTNKSSAGQHNACETDVERYLLKRQARMGLLEKDKVALRIVGPLDINLHVGQIINFEWYNKYNKQLLYGSGTYIVSGLNHNIQFGGFSTSTLDCVSVTAGGGIV